MKEKVKKFCDLKAGDSVYYVSPYMTDYVIEELELVTDFKLDEAFNSMRATASNGRWITINNSSWKKTICKSDYFYSTIEEASKALYDNLCKEVERKEVEIDRHQRQVTRYVKEKGDLLKIMTKIESKDIPIKKAVF